MGYNFDMDPIKKNRYFLFTLLIISVAPLFLPCGIGKPYQNGEIIDPIICKNNPEQSYALYLPHSYSRTKNKKWPLILAFDPAARGSIPLKHFKESSDLYGYIIVCSNNSRNGPLQPTVDAMKTVWLDVLGRFNIDKNRVIATGFSGGSRVSTLLSRVIKNPVKGIIGCGAGLSHLIKPEQIKPSLYYGLVGFADFNYLEMNELDTVFDQLKVTHYMRYYNGDHQWPPGLLCTEAVEWMEIHVMKQGVTEKNIPLINSLFKKKLAQIQGIEKKGDLYFAVREYESMVETFGDFKDVSEIRDTIIQLKKHKTFKTFLKAENKRFKREKDFKHQSNRAFFRIKKRPVNEINIPRILREIGLYHMEKEIKKDNIYERGLALRSFFDLGFKSMEAGDNFYKKKDYDRAILYYKIGIKAGKKYYYYPWILYNLACAHSLNSSKKNALKYLKMAVQSGYKNLAHMKRDKDLDPIREEPEFKKILSLIE